MDEKDRGYSNGQIKFTQYWGSSLMKQDEMFRGIPEGIADIGWWTFGEAGQTPLNEYAESH